MSDHRSGRVTGYPEVIDSDEKPAIRNVPQNGGRISITRDADALFLMIDATANTSWLPPTLERDAKGYIYTGRDLTGWPFDREPFPLETSLPRIFCAGDVRHGSIKRVASGVGEGSMSIAFIHQYLALTGSPDLTRV